MASKKSSYRRKQEMGLVPTRYDRESKSFQLGAWKNLNREEYRRNQRALERVAS